MDALLFDLKVRLYEWADCAIIIAKLPKSIQKFVLKQYFSRFGDVREVRIDYSKKVGSPREGIICFKNSEAARLALLSRYHIVGFRRLKIAAWPMQQRPCRIQAKAAENGYSAIHQLQGDPELLESHRGILSLDDQNLVDIFCHLDTLSSLRLSMSHPRLQALYCDVICPKLHSSCNVKELLKFSLKELRHYLRTVGKFVQKIKIPAPNVRRSESEAVIFLNMMENCHQVRVLQIVKRPLIFDTLLDMFDVVLMTELELIDCDLVDSDLVFLLRMQNLRALGLGRNERLQGRILPRLSQLRRLSLFGCDSFTESTIILILLCLELEYLDIRFIENASSFTVLFFHCEHLETLKLSHFDDAHLEFMRRPMKNLRSLELQYMRLGNRKLVNYLNHIAERDSVALEELHVGVMRHILGPDLLASICRFEGLHTLSLEGFVIVHHSAFVSGIGSIKTLRELSVQHTNATNSDVLDLIRLLPLLKVLDVRFCALFFLGFVPELIGLLKVGSEKPPLEPLLLFAYGTRIGRNVLHAQIYSNSRKWIQISFHSNFMTRGYLNEKREESSYIHDTERKKFLLFPSISDESETDSSCDEEEF